MSTTDIYLQLVLHDQDDLRATFNFRLLDAELECALIATTLVTKRFTAEMQWLYAWSSRKQIHSLSQALAYGKPVPTFELRDVDGSFLMQFVPNEGQDRFGVTFLGRFCDNSAVPAVLLQVTGASASSDVVEAFLRRFVELEL